MRARWLGPTLAAALGVLALAAWAGWRATDRGRSAGALEEARRRIAQGAPDEARPLLVEAGGGPEAVAAEALYLLGACEKALGRPDAAEAAWARVPAGSDFAAPAALMRAREALGRDRLAQAETLLPAALGLPGGRGVEAREYLLYLFKIQGRLDEAARVLRDGWDAFPDRGAVVQQLWALDRGQGVPLEEQRRVLAEASASAPDDDRVKLGLADLALREGRLDEAGRLLQDCLRARPDDPAAWRARLAWARASGDEPAAVEALRRLPPGRLAPAEVLGLRAWFAERAGDLRAEREALAGLVERAPGDASALERLAAATLRAGDAEGAARLRDRKAEVDRLRVRYGPRIHRPDPAADAPELALQAEALGRWFEARKWWELAGPHPEAPAALARIARAEALAAAGPGPSDLLAELDAAPRRPAGSAAAAALAGGAGSRFEEDAGAAGLRFAYESGLDRLRQIPATMGSGLALLDYDGDGWLDLYCTQGGPFPPLPGPRPNADKLFRNRGDGTFEDATEAAGIAAFPGGYGHGVAVGDVDDDGHPDLFVMRWRSCALYRNRGDGTFEDVTEPWGLGGDAGWPTSAAFADLDGDGDLDLYVCQYLAWDADDPPICPKADRGGRPFVCSPASSPPLPDRLYRNEGGRFVDASAEAGITADEGRGMGVVACDLDGDGRLDLFVANDMTANFLWRNLGGFRFEEVGHESGVAAAGSGGYQASMGIACGDLDGDGRPDLAVTNFYNEGTTLYQGLGGGVFRDASASAGLTAASRFLLGFGAEFLDFDSDGRLDLATVNGHVDDYRPDAPYAMPVQLLAGTGGGALVDVSGRAGPALLEPRVARALVVGDLDNDGRPDLVLTALDAPLALLRNRTGGGRSLTLALEGAAGGPGGRDAVGARVEVVAGGRTLVGWRRGGGSYQSASDPRLHFGLGDAGGAESVRVAWPSGRVDAFGPLPAGGYRLRECEPAARPLPGFRAPEASESTRSIQNSRIAPVSLARRRHTG